MRWPFHKSTTASPSPSLDWASRLGELGGVLDRSGLVLRDVALSMGGDDVWLCGFVWWSTRLQSGWSAVSLRIVGVTLAPGGSAAVPASSPGGNVSQASWGARLGQVGALLDQTGRTLRHPVVLEVGDGFVVTAQAASTATALSRGPVSYGFTAVDLAAAPPRGTS